MSPMQPGLVSVIVPVHNRPSLVREAVASVLAQTHRPLEILLVDDGSTDETPSVLAAVAAEHPEIRVLRQANAGPGAARELGRVHASGEFIQYLDSDDLLLPGKLERQVAGLRAHPECGVSYGWTRYRYADGTVDSKPCKGTGRRLDRMFPAFLRGRPWHTSTPLYRASVCAAAGPWLPLRQEEDWEYDCRVAALGTRLHHVEAFVSEHRDHLDDRLSRRAATDPGLLADRASAHAHILRHALDAGIPADSPEMRHFTRALFLLCRQCGAHGLEREAAALHALAVTAAGERGAPGDLKAYRWAARLLGWRWAGKLATAAYRLRA